MNDFKYVCKDNDFIDYILSFWGKNLIIYFNKHIFNKNLNIILNSGVAKNVEMIWIIEIPILVFLLIVLKNI